MAESNVEGPTKKDEYDAQHGRPSATPDAKPISEADAWGTALNPVRETPSSFRPGGGGQG